VSPYNPAGRTEVLRLERQLQELLGRYEASVRSPALDPEVGSDLAKYVCVRICGFVDQSLVTLTVAHSEAKSAPTVARFAASWMARTQNPKRGRLIEFAGRFRHDWGEELDKALEAIDPTDSLNSLVQTRNDIAHGLSSGVGHDTLIRYFGLAVDIVAWFVDKLDPKP
jgi:RiboL-PSP-HEPN